MINEQLLSHHSLRDLPAGKLEYAKQQFVQQIEHTFNRTKVLLGADLVPDLIRAIDLNFLNSACYDLTKELNAAGCSVEVEYYVKSGTQDPPLVVLVARDEKGRYVFPNTNMRFNPAIPLASSGAADSGQKQMLSPSDQPEEGGLERKYLPALELETFSSASEIRIVIDAPDTPDVPYRIYPLFSVAAFEEATEHAIDTIKEQSYQYSYLVDELLCPLVASEINQHSAFFGERDIPEMQDCGSDKEQHLFRLTSSIPYYDFNKSASIEVSIQLVAMSPQARLLLFDDTV